MVSWGIESLIINFNILVYKYGNFEHYDAFYVLQDWLEYFVGYSNDPTNLNTEKVKVRYSDYYCT